MVKTVTESMEIYQKDPISLPLFRFIQELQTFCPTDVSAENLTNRIVYALSLAFTELLVDSKFASVARRHTGL